MTGFLRLWWRRISRTSVREALLLGEAQWTLLACQAARWLTPKGRLVAIQPHPPPSQFSRSHRDAAGRVGWAVTRAAHYGLFRPRCLVRSLALQRMLRRRGVHTSTLRIGVRWDGGTLAAHAWVELGGQVLGDSPAYVSQFTPTTNLGMGEL